ncbi:Uncharacterized protein BP5553_03098 [Venustampulla echinocandica]|uniref:Glutathione S-transferase n=1 Tax=Venustampulla echinocandica TaxID=2656787 RepID=A0A370TTE2_9HELO|nr:Uncharacterized protein BP5553_03098 [Venustampulla echinocandica]RDL38758.1 Uncharacterized protein BP5553_03098 [Venustampulla echinocandica]
MATATAEATSAALNPTPSTGSAGKPTLHHLNNSQSQRILWLLEELGIEYNVVNHKRKRGRAPAELSKVHQLGKSPTLVTSTGRVVVESTAVASYLIETYDTTGKFATRDPLRDEELTSFAGSSLGNVTAIELLVDLLATVPPWPISWFLGTVRSQVQKTFTTAEFEKAMRFLESELGDQEWFNGENLGRSDIIISWPLDCIAGRKWVNFDKDYPKLAAWRKRVTERDAWKRGLEKGNGYDLSGVDQD